MTEIVIRRCTTSVVRRGGWSWGADTRRLVDGVVATVPEVIRREVNEALDQHAGGTVTIDEPVRLIVSVRIGELAASRAGPPSLSDILSRYRPVLADAIRRAASETAAPQEHQPPGPRREPAGSGAGGDPVEPAPDRPITSDLLTLLLAVHRRGGLADLLRLTPTVVVAAWLTALGVGAGSPGADPSRGNRPLSRRGGGDIESRSPATAAGDPDVGPGDRQGRGELPVAARRLALAIAVADELGLRPDDHRVLAALDGRSASDESRAEPATSSTPTSPANQVPSAEPVGGAAVTPTGRRGGNDFVAADVPVLPFLLLGPLDELGLLEAIGASFAAADATASLPAFAVALAHKTLSPPERGWRRAAADHHGAAAFAGRPEPLAEGELSSLVGDAAVLVGGPAALLTAALVARHVPGGPVVVHGPRSGGVMVAAGDDLTMFGWGDDDAWLAALLTQLGDPPVFVGPGEPSLQSFATIMRPGPGAPPDSSQLDRWRLLVDLAEALAARPAMTLTAEPILERALTMIAAAGLATMAHRLWAEVEPTDPLLVFERFGDFRGSVIAEGDRLRVLLPMGRRRSDLFDRGLMEEVAGVPWFGGRPVLFDGG